MKILLTGASSFTGLWFAEALVARGHTIIAPLFHSKTDYQGIRKARVERLKNCADIIFECPLGSESFFELLESHGPFDLFCHHAADVSNYKSSNFDFSAALKSNTFNIKKIMELLNAQKCQKLLLTGSVFEQREGIGSDPLQAVSPYGLSKGLTSDVFAYFAELYGLHLGKFVIPNPYGPYEEGRFTTYLANCWLKKETATVTFPNYVRDNIPVSLLALSYASFAEQLPKAPGFSKLSPSFEPDSQGAFVTKFAKEMEKRFNTPCEFSLLEQTDFPEPKVRINSDRLEPKKLGWNEPLAWDALAEFYARNCR
jgi:UDP-glucose 4-epimerase